MQREAAKKLIRDTFEQPFNKEQFTTFAKNLLNHLEPAPFPRPRSGQMIFEDFRSHVASFDRVGKFTDADDNKLDVLIVNLSKGTSLDRARATQRKFVAKYLKESQGAQLKDAALVAFVSPNEEDWRFSFVKMDYKIETTEKGRVKVKEEFTPARRYSYLVGKNENSHTAQSQLLPILENTEKNPTLAQLEEAFRIEKVTKEFFEQYRELYHNTKVALDELVAKDKDIRADFDEKGVDSVDFAKKLLGQIVFLYFLQKKGWFGVGKKSEWGQGSKRFLRELFERKHADYKNFFNDILEPLFYNTLAVEHPDDYSDKFDCRIPFLNGGLFDPLNQYDWQRTDVLLPDELFSNQVKNSKTSDTGTGILDVFDRYNFTVKEDEPLEKEVAVDPEMLGKVFENLLEVKDRKSKGTYYTPREIVHYMCQESLINYLATELDGTVPREDIATLIKHGETAQENDTLVNERGEERGRYKFKLPESIRNNAEVIDQKLADIKVCDPAVGSGAFLVGMMSEIVRTRMVLTQFIGNGDRTAYDLKRHAIQNSLYGVDIDLGAVEIAKLRLWLSLIVDEDDYKQIKPLPNLDYKIMQGNSLLEEYEGIKLIDERFFEKQEEKAIVRQRLERDRSKLQREYIQLNTDRKLTRTKKAELEKKLKEIDKTLKELDKPRSNGQDELGLYGKSEVRSKADRLLELHEQFFSAYNKRQKDQLKTQIDALTWDLIEATLKHQGKSEKLEDVRRFQRTNTRPFFLWKLNFADVFGEKGGFDVVIANPPYGAKIPKSDLKTIMNKVHVTKNTNSAALFIDLGANNFISKRGTLSFIVPKSLLYSERWFSLVETLLGHTLSLVDVEKAFEKVKLEQVVFIYGAAGGRSDYRAYKFVDSIFTSAITIENEIPQLLKAWVCDVTESELAICRRILNKPHILMRDISETHRGVGLQRELKKSGAYAVIGGKNIVRFGLDGVKGFLSKASLEKHKKKLSIMSRPKIISQDVIAHVQNPIPHILITAHFDRDGSIYGLDTVQNTVLTSGEYEPEFVLGLLNSTLVSWYTYRFIYCSAIRTMHFDNCYIGRIPIPIAKSVDRKSIVSVVNRMLDFHRDKTDVGDMRANSVLQKDFDELDGLIYRLYGIDAEDVKTICGTARHVSYSQKKVITSSGQMEN